MFWLLLISVFLGFCLGSIILPPDIEYKGPPVCTSLGSLCGLNYRYVTDDDEPIQILHSENEICQCPDNITCAIANEWDNMTNSVVLRLLTGGGHQLLVKISYCHLSEKKKRRACGFNKPVLVSRGRGMFKFDVVGDIMCKCNRPLVPKSDWIEGEYDYVEYGCGQPKCFARNTKICSEVTLTDENLKSQYFCRCRKYEMCSGDLPIEDGQTVQHRCQLIQ